MKRTILVFKTAILATVLSTLLTFTARANDGVFYVNGNQLVPLQETRISIVSEVLTISIGDDGQATVDVDYKLQNNGPAKTVTMGFEAGAPYNDEAKMNPEGRHPYISDFTVLMNGQLLSYSNAVVASGDFKPLDLKRWKTTEGQDFEQSNNLYDARRDSLVDFAYAYYFKAPFKKGLNEVHHTYRYRMSYGVGRTFELPYWLLPAMRWANRQIDDFTLRIKAENTAKHFCMADSIFRGGQFCITEGQGKVRTRKLSYGEQVIEIALRNGTVEWHQQNFKPIANMWLQSADIIYAFDNEAPLGSFYDRNEHYVPSWQKLFDNSFTPWERRVLRNLPYANRGYVFRSRQLQDYFSQLWWYMPDAGWQASTKDFTAREKRLVEEARHKTDNLKVQALKLKNGLTVWLNVDHSQPKIYGALVVRAGAKDCPNTGIAHYLEHVLFKGTQKIGTVDYQAEKPWLDSISAKYNLLSQTTDESQRLLIQKDISRLSQRAADYAIPNEFDRLISKYGGSALNASTSWDCTEYHNTFSPQYLEKWCELNSERMLNPVFRLFQGELETVYEEKNRAADNMTRGALEKVMEAAFKGHPYQYPIIGSTENLKNPRLQDMEDFFHRYYVAGNMCLILSGDFKTDDLEPLLERTFGRLPKGEAPKTAPPTLQPFNGESIDIKLDVPIIKAVGLLFRGPVTKSKDYHTMQLAMRLLSNDNHTGMLDSLRTAHKVLMAMGQNMALSEAGAIGLAVIPKLPFGSKKKAEQLCWQQIERLKRGEFSDGQLEELKSELLRNITDELESISSRAGLMTDVYTDGGTWEDFLQRTAAIKDITKADIIGVANRYLLSDQYLRGVKKFGSYPKDKLTQPGYKPVVPKHTGEQSAYARKLAELPVAEQAPRLIDLKHDTELLPINDHVVLHKVENPVNDVFELTLKWDKGLRDEPRLALLNEYIGELGTDSLTPHRLRESWQHLGTTIGTSVEDDCFMITLRGFEHSLAPSVKLLGHVLDAVKADKKVMSDLVKEYKTGKKQLTRENSEVLSMVIARLALGNRSSYLRMPTIAEVKKTKGEDVLQLLDDVRKYDCSVLYSGQQPAETVAELCRQYLSPETSRLRKPENTKRLQETKERTVYIYDMPDTRQTFVGIYGSLKTSLTDQELAQLRLWSQYMGGGMSSLLFQEIREFRAMAYATGAFHMTPNLVRHRDDPSGYVAYLGTQSDKTMQALAVLDSLIEHMPVNEQNISSARQEILNNINNSYPTFRKLADEVTSYTSDGYTEDPRTVYARIVPTLTANDVTTFYKQNIQGKPRAVFIIGNKRQLDMQQLATYGNIVELKENDILNK